MGILFALLATIGESIAKTVDKLNFTRNRISSRQLLFLVFLGMFISLLLFIVITRQPLPQFSLITLGLALIIGLVSFASNVLDVLSLRVNDISLREPMLDFEPAVAGLVGYIFFPAERKTGYLIAFILAFFIVRYGTHRRTLQKAQRKGMSYMLLATLLNALLPNMYKVTLGYMSPAYIAFFRVAAVLVLATLFFSFKNQDYSAKKVTYGLTSGVIYAAETVFSLYAIHILGVVVTMLLLLLGPALRYISGYFILKEKVRRGEVMASLLLAGVVLAAVFS
jgi:drug/metabolite transporter (DMT)-like permease